MKHFNKGISGILGCMVLWAILILPSVTQAAPPSGCVTGRIVDADSSLPVNWATVTIVQLSRTEPAHNDGAFSFCQVPPGAYTLSVEHLGYRSQQVEFRVSSYDTTHLEIRLEASVLQSEEVVVTARRDGTSFAAVGSTRTLSGANLQQQLGRTLAETIENEPGVAKQSMGPATARPVVRGLGGDRLVILEDGAPTGDASSISPDHAVAADPMTAERIEVLRGPASFIYSSNALGGVINLEREKTIANRPDRIHGTGSLQGESVNTGIALGTSLGIPAGPFGIQFQGSYRNAGDISTPDGDLQNTDLETFDGSTGINWLFAQGSLGGSGGYYKTSYGVPGGFAGAHANGVRIDMNRTQYAARLDYHLPSSLLNRIQADWGYSDYYHEEVEPGGIIGTKFGILTTTGSVRLHHDSICGIVDRGILNIQGENVNFAATGVHVPQTYERSIGASLFEEKRLGRVTLSGAFRFDLRGIEPARTDSSEVGFIRTRTFNGLSGGLAADYKLTDAFDLNLSATRTFRTPSIEELFSDGPHLAAYSYEIGNADLGAETGLSLEGSLRFSSTRGHTTLTFFRNAIDGYIFPRITGDTNYRTLLPIYQHVGEEALLNGFEGEAEWEIIDGLAGTGTISYVRGERVGEETPLPFIPPLNGSLGLRWQSGSFLAGVTARAATAQNRVGEFESTTDGYVVIDAVAQYRIAGESFLHTVVLGVDNALDTTWRNHLSRTKSIMPEPGRNIRLLYRIYF